MQVIGPEKGSAKDLPGFTRCGHSNADRYQLQNPQYGKGIDQSPGREYDCQAGEIQQVIKDLRQICTDLRPANLEISGLLPAIQSKAAEIEQQAGFQVSFLLEGNEEQEICE
jgi:signal transduction histidine kinase